MTSKKAKNLFLQAGMIFLLSVVSPLVVSAQMGFGEMALAKAASSGLPHEKLLGRALELVSPIQYCETLTYLRAEDRRGYLNLLVTHSGFMKNYGLEGKGCKDTEELAATPFKGGKLDPNNLDMALNLARENWTQETFNIDLLKIDLFLPVELGDGKCHTGNRLVLELAGVIGPDSSFAVDRLFERYPVCADAQGVLIEPSIISLNSGGGYLEHGYALGRLLSDRGAIVIIDANAVCASSCAVAFLGGNIRVISDTGKIVFHSPYFDGKNEYGARDIDCAVGEEALAKLNRYYTDMVGEETGDRLFERTMWYCSADDGWVVTGGSAAELYGIATEK